MDQRVPSIFNRPKEMDNKMPKPGDLVIVPV